MNNSPTNLDEVDSYVAFIFQGHEYQVWFPNSVQSLEIKKLSGDNEKVQEYILGFLVRKPKDADYPDFKDVFKDMNVKQISLFYKLINAAINDGGN